jgi:murein DD-endopeptidase MepM/ murein hydrolase activator NlpD
MSSAYRPQRAEQNPFHIYAVGDSPFQSAYTPQAFPGELPRRPARPPKATNNVVTTPRFAPNLQQRKTVNSNKAWIVVCALLVALFGLILAPNFLNMPALQSSSSTTNTEMMLPPSVPKLQNKSARAYMVRQPQIRTRTVRAVTYKTLSIPFSSWLSPSSKTSKTQTALQPTFTNSPIINGILTSPFGQRWHHRHQGVDIAAPFGTPIYSAADGKVVYSGWVGGYGQSLLVDHGKGYKTRYAHCSKLLVRTGQRVKSGQAIARVGSSGHSTGPHLHFEVLLHGIHKNPGRFFRLTPPFSPLSKK